MTQETKAAADNDAPSGGEQSIEQLQDRYQALNKRKIQAETHLQNARDQLSQLKKQAQEAYGTDDVDELRKLLAKMKAENETKRQKYQAELDRIEGELATVEHKFAATESPVSSDRKDS